MNKEAGLIRVISNAMPRAQGQLNGLFEADAEIVEFGGSRMLVTVDEFSEEDMLREHDPFVLGRNLAIGAISDIFAAGGEPLYYAHSMTVSKAWNEDYIKQFSDGVASVLKETGTGFIGGDFGKSKVWRYTATVIGALEGKPLLRSGASPGDGIFISGPVGTGNLEAFLKMYSDKKLAGRLAKAVKSRFALRRPEAALVRKYATACIDTSDGAFNAVNTLADMSNTGYEISNLPFIRTGAVAAKLFGIPKELLFLGECGEYELLFTVGAQDEEAFLKDAQSRGLVFYNIGRMTGTPGRVLYEDGRQRDLSLIDVRARDFEDIKAYVGALINAL